MTDSLTFIRRYGQEIETVTEALGKLRIAVFHDFPYLYEGSLNYEKEYLKIYVASEQAFLFAVYDGTEMVGATTCLPLADEAPELRAPFEKAGMDIASIFYFGESILLPQYRGHGLGHQFFDEREAHARSFGTYAWSCFCAVDRGENHPQQPADYRPNDAFWHKRGYRREPALTATMTWPDLGETDSTPKKMIFWTKSLTEELT